MDILWVRSLQLPTTDGNVDVIIRKVVWNLLSYSQTFLIRCPLVRPSHQPPSPDDQI